jgi:hypothetical protein
MLHFVDDAKGLQFLWGTFTEEDEHAFGHKSRDELTYLGDCAPVKHGHRFLSF